MKKDALYFLKKFDKIPDNKWTIGDFVIGDKKCAMGHCGSISSHFSDEAWELMDLFEKYDEMFSVASINDNKNYDVKKHYTIGLLGSKPKKRIMNALYLIHAMESYENSID